MVFFNPGRTLCLRQGYNCTCPQCQIWITRWDRELDAFSMIDAMIQSGNSLFEIYERLRASAPEVLTLYHKTIESQYIVRRYGIECDSVDMDPVDPAV